MAFPKTLGELKSSQYNEQKYKNRSVKDEMRENLIRKLQFGETVFEGVVGYEDTVTPQLVNAILAKHNIILLGLRGQAKSRILRSLVNLLDDYIPVVSGSEINDNPYAPLCRTSKVKLAEMGDETPIDFVPRDRRYVEKLATPDVTIADIIGDVDPIKAARGGHQLSDELTIHYGLLPRANRGIFAINELPDLAGKIQVGLFNIMQEGDIQIKGYPIRLPLDVAIVFSANPEDYTARGKIITPLKDRIGSEIHTHYPATVDAGVTITRQEAWIKRPLIDGLSLSLPKFIPEIVEHIAFVAREDSRIDKRSGVSQRLPISVIENVISSAERRAIINRESLVVPRISDIYASLPSITGKIELEYEGEQLGHEKIARDLIKRATGQAFMHYYSKAEYSKVVDWFNRGGSLKVSDSEPSEKYLATLKKIPGLIDLVAFSNTVALDKAAEVVSAAEFLLEGLYAQKKLARNEQNVYTVAKQEKQSARYYTDWSDTGGVN
ncbi:MAG: magnesium chelatase [Blastocatellia bacterium]|nr:magnesium chelatase [Blastocatellia bacterium]